MQYIGYKSGKHAITELTQGLKEQKRKKKCRRKIPDAKQVDFCVKYGLQWDIPVLN